MTRQLQPTPSGQPARQRLLELQPQDGTVSTMTVPVSNQSPTSVLTCSMTQESAALIATLSEAIAATEVYRSLAGGGPVANPERDRAQWRCVETWVAAVTEVRVAALQALPEALHALL